MSGPSTSQSSPRCVMRISWFAPTYSTVGSCWDTRIGVVQPQLYGYPESRPDRKSTRLNSSHDQISYAVFCLKKKKKKSQTHVDKSNCFLDGRHGHHQEHHHEEAT